MRVVGIIAEYNPLHTGHVYHLWRAKTLSGADYAVVVMSPDFTQRGEPAVFDKYTRTKMALLAGADLVLELPVCYATGSAEYFAQGAVAILAGTGVVDAICFGAEAAEEACASSLRAEVAGKAGAGSFRAETSADVLAESCLTEKAGESGQKGGKKGSAEIFLEAARLLNGETAEFQTVLRAQLRAGATFPQARARALTETGQEGTALLLSSPNNILGVEYCRALLKLHSGIRPIPIKRLGSAYDSRSLSGEFCSAAALRAQISRIRDSGEFLRRQDSSADCQNKMPENPDSGTDCPALFTWGNALGAVRPYIPRSCLPLFYQACKTAVFPDSLLPALRYRLLLPESFDDIFGLAPQLALRLDSLRFSCMGKRMDEITELLKTRQITEAAVRRALLHLILGIRASETEEARAAGIAYCARILGFRKEAAPLLHAIRKNGSLPLIARPSAAGRLLTGPGKRLWEQDLFASHYYESLHSGTFRTEYERSPVILG